MNICLFEDEKVSNLYPITYLHPVFHLRVGAFTIEEKIKAVSPENKICHLCRPYISDYFRFDTPVSDETYLFINASVIPYSSTLEFLLCRRENPVIDNGRLAAFYGTVEEFKAVETAGKNETSFERPILFHYIWNLFDHNEAMLDEDFEYVEGEICASGFGSVHFINPEQIKIGNNVTLEPGVVLNASDGPVMLGDEVTVQANTTIKGPVYLGEKTLVKSGAKLYGHLSCGPVCKLNGEIEESIILGYSNKQHDGFLGHAYLGEWINLGAGTTNSDLKNNYGEITVSLNGETIKTGRRFLGLIMGDHSKSAINTSFNTGTIVGVSTNIFTRTFPPKFIASFSWVGDDGIQDYRIDKAMEVAATVMGRRDKPFGEAEKKLFENILKLTRESERSGKEL